jgi:hypothetical protein
MGYKKDALKLNSPKMTLKNDKEHDGISVIPALLVMALHFFWGLPKNW